MGICMFLDKGQVDGLIREKSELALELEQVRHQLSKENEELRLENEALKIENERLQQELQQRDEIQMKMREQLSFVTETASTLYKKFRDFKIKYYQEQGYGG